MHKFLINHLVISFNSKGGSLFTRPLLKPIPLETLLSYNKNSNLSTEIINENSFFYLSYLNYYILRKNLSKIILYYIFIKFIVLYEEGIEISYISNQKIFPLFPDFLKKYNFF